VKFSVVDEVDAILLELALERGTELKTDAMIELVSTLIFCNG